MDILRLWWLRTENRVDNEQEMMIYGSILSVLACDCVFSRSESFTVVAAAVFLT